MDAEFEEWKQKIIESYLPKHVELAFSDSQAAKYYGIGNVTSPDGIEFSVIYKQRDDFDEYNEGTSSRSNRRPGQTQRLSEDTGLVGID